MVSNWFAPQKYSMTSFPTDTPQSWLHQQLRIVDEVTPWNRTPKILGVKLDTHFTFGPHVRDCVKRALSAFNAVIKALAESSRSFTTERTYFGFTCFTTETYLGDSEKMRTLFSTDFEPSGSSLYSTSII